MKNKKTLFTLFVVFITCVQAVFMCLVINTAHKVGLLSDVGCGIFWALGILSIYGLELLIIKEKEDEK